MNPLFAEAREQARRAAARAHGWLSDAQGEALFAAAAAVPDGLTIVEIGSWQGRSTIWLAAGARRAGQSVFAVDPHEGSREDPAARTLGQFTSNLADAGLLDVVTPLVMRSTAAAAEFRDPVGLLFIDGDHSDAGARADAESWLPRLATGGTVMFHDVATSGYSGPRRVFQRRVCWSGDFHRVRRVGSMGIAERTTRRGRGSTVRGTLFGILLFRYDLQRALKSALRGVRRAITRAPVAMGASL